MCFSRAVLYGLDGKLTPPEETSGGQGARRRASVPAALKPGSARLLRPAAATVAPLAQAAAIGVLQAESLQGRAPARPAAMGANAHRRLRKSFNNLKPDAYTKNSVRAFYYCQRADFSI